MRNKFDMELEELNSELIKMGALCEEGIAGATKALSDGDITLAQSIEENAVEIDRLEREIEGKCMKLLLHQQPVARDLRQISAALKMITDMQRIGDQADDIAEIVTFMNGRTSEEIDTIDKMAQATVKMVTESIDAFVKKDVESAKKVIEYDNVVDELFDETKYNIIQMITNKPEDGAYALDLLMISKYLERIGDHATNIAEWVIYAITGHHKEE